MKKLLAVVLSLMALSSALTGCGSDIETSTSKDGTTSKEVTQSKNELDDSSVESETDTDTDEEPNKNLDSTEDSDTAETDKTGSTDFSIDNYNVASFDSLDLSLASDTPLGEQVISDVELNDEIFNGLNALKNSSKYTVEMTMYTVSEGMTFDVPMVLCSDGASSYVTSNTLGLNLEILTLGDGQQYLLNSDECIYCKADDPDLSDIDASDAKSETEEIFDIQDNAVEASTVVVDDDEFTRVKYTQDDSNCYAYFYGNRLAYMTMSFSSDSYDESVGAIVIVDEFNTDCNVDFDNMLALYEEVSTEDYMGFAFGDMFSGLGDVLSGESDLDLNFETGDYSNTVVE